MHQKFFDLYFLDIILKISKTFENIVGVDLIKCKTKNNHSVTLFVHQLIVVSYLYNSKNNI